jgi:hypothetical protein
MGRSGWCERVNWARGSTKLKKSCQHRIEALPASAGRREAFLVEGQKSAIEQPREATTK